MSPTKPRTSRRTFLGVAGTVLIGASAAGRTTPAARRRPPRAGSADGKIRLAVAGGGFGAAQHWHEHPGCEVARPRGQRGRGGAQRRVRVVDRVAA